MGFKPIGKNVLVTKIENKEEVKNGIILPKKEDEQYYHGVIKSVGGQCIKEVTEGLHVKVKKDQTTFAGNNNLLFFCNETDLKIKNL